MNANKSLQLRLQLGNAGEDASVQSSAFKLRKPSFHSIQPRGAGRCGMKVDSRLAGDPRGDFLGFVGAQVIQHDMQVLVFWRLPLDLLQECEKLLGSGSFLHATNDFRRSEY